ncbi:MAG: hypothetical protein GC153_01670 [Alphaproteobacteria bacterium]|nr:hypothetical protein [Alphaproteobacteria bacterium]
MVWFLVGAVIVAAAIAGLYWRWSKRINAQIAEGGALEWERLKQNEPALIEGVDRAKFDAIYHRVHFPRFPKYALAAVAGFVLALPVTFSLLFAVLWIAEKLNLTPDAKQIANHYLVDNGHMRLIHDATPDVAYYYLQDLGGFYYFFGVLLAWLAIVAFVMRRFHQRRPGHLREEIIRARK